MTVNHPSTLPPTLSSRQHYRRYMLIVSSGNAYKRVRERQASAAGMGNQIAMYKHMPSRRGSVSIRNRTPTCLSSNFSTPCDTCFRLSCYLLALLISSGSMAKMPHQVSPMVQAAWTDVRNKCCGLRTSGRARGRDRSRNKP